MQKKKQTYKSAGKTVIGFKCDYVCWFKKKKN